MEIYIVYVPHEGGNGKTRPILVIERDEKFYVAYNITTQYSGKSEYIRSKYYPLKDWKQTGLLKQGSIASSSHAR